jgi:hypothetical protein
MVNNFLGQVIKFSGFRGKTLWDWTSLLMFPILLGGLAGWFLVSTDRANHEREVTQAQNQLQYINLLNQSQDTPVDKLAEIQRDPPVLPSSIQPGLEPDRIRQEVLQSYLQRVTTLVLEENLTTSQPGDPVRNIARSYALDAIRQLDGVGKSRLVGFLYASHLIGNEVEGSRSLVPIVSIDEVDLSEVDLSGSNLNGSILRRVNLSKAKLDSAHLEGAILSYANLSQAHLSAAYLNGAILSDASLTAADLSGADLSGADLRGADLAGARLSNANLSDADLGGAQNLIIDQLCVATSLQSTKGIAPVLIEQLREQCPQLLEGPLD